MKRRSEVKPAGDPSASVLLEDAAAGRLPAWAQASPKRYAHMSRVAELMGDWAARLGAPTGEQTRWRATAFLHDALRDADPEHLRNELAGPFANLPGEFLHGPAAAARLEAAGVSDPELLEAIRYHTLGAAGLSRLSRALIAADWLDPGRPDQPIERATLRARMPEALDDVFATIAGKRLRTSLDRGKPIRSELVAMWNSAVTGDGRAH